MNIGKLLKTTSDKEILDAINLHYGDKELTKYKRLIHKLRKMEIIENKDNLTVYIQVYKEIDDEDVVLVEDFDQMDSELFFDVSAYDGTDIVYSIASVRFIDFLSLYVDSKTMEKISPPHILAHCLYEVTAYSFKDKKYSTTVDDKDVHYLARRHIPLG